MNTSPASSASMPLLLLAASFMRLSAAADIPVPDTGNSLVNGASLAAAIATANATPADDVIILTPGAEYLLDTANNSDVPELGANGLPSIVSGITIRGGFASATAPTSIRRADGVEFRIFLIQATGRLRLDSVRVSNGSALSAPWPIGGGIFNSGGQLEMFHAELSDNMASRAGGLANYVFAGVASPPAFDASSAWLEESTVANNKGTNSSGAIINAGALTIERSTISGNQGDESGGGISSGGLAANVRIFNSTISSNRTSTRAGVTGGISVSSGRATLGFSTVTGNAGYGITASPGAIVAVSNSIVAGNRGTDIMGTSGNEDCQGTIRSDGHNLIGSVASARCTFAVASGDMAGSPAAPVDPRLGPLANNMGFTLTHALLSGSPARNNAVPARSGCPATDQRGELRPRGGAACDTGAFQASLGLCDKDGKLCVFEIDVRFCAVYFSQCYQHVLPFIDELVPKFPVLEPKVLGCRIDGPGCGPLPPLK